MIHGKSDNQSTQMGETRFMDEDTNMDDENITWMKFTKQHSLKHMDHAIDDMDITFMSLEY